MPAVIATGFSSRAGADRSGGVTGEMASRVSIAASMVDGAGRLPRRGWKPYLQARRNSNPGLMGARAIASRGRVRGLRGAAGLLLMLALGELLDDLRAERRQVVRLARAHQALVDDDLLVDPL